MTPERWQKVEEVLQGALDLPSQERVSFLDAACGEDDELKREAGSLISAHDEAGNFIEQPAIAEDAHILLGRSVGREVGPYTILECLGSGGMGEVYLAQDRRLDRPVALKILPAYLAADDARLRRFQREARAASALNHPNILTIHEVGEHEDIRFIATEFIDGQTLGELIASGNLSVDEIVEIVSQVASALSAAHAAGIVHRDIKPENIMRRSDGLVKILDFGIAKLVEHETPSTFPNIKHDARVQTEVGVVMGTVNYMSPEQARAVEVDKRTDIWSLGVLLYEMLTNRLPFIGATRMDALVSILEREPAALFVDDSKPEIRSLQKIVDKTLRKNRNDRYQTAEDLLRELKLVTNPSSLGLSSRSSSSRLTIQHAKSRKGLMMMAFGALVLVLVGGAIVFKGWISHPQTNIAAAPTGTLTTKAYLQMSGAEQLAFISEQEQRVSTMMGDRPVKLNDEALRAIKTYVDRWVERDGQPGDLGDESLNVVYTRAQSHVPLITRSFAARKVPVIIGIYLPVIESAYRNCYENSIGAKGLFQFLPQTARQYGVAHEEMCDVEKMAPAAAHYIADRMAELGEDSQSVTLVLLSYNRGPESVRDDLRELRDTENYQRNFWTLFAHRDKLDEQFRKESAGYVPAFFAAAIIGENPKAFDLPMPPLSSLANL
ncbi:MAG: serine/threonine-protein kinase [Acidobacteriota bacterium]